MTCVIDKISNNKCTPMTKCCTLVDVIVLVAARMVMETTDYLSLNKNPIGYLIVVELTVWLMALVHVQVFEVCR